MSHLVDGGKEEYNMKIKLALLDKDKNYLERLSTVFLNKYPDRIEFYSFSDSKVALQCVQSGKVEVFLANEQFEVNVADIPENTCFAYIAENAETEEIHGQRTIFKYQRAETFYKQILDFYAENTTKVISGYSSNHQNTTEVISFGSFSGGTGCSTVAAAFCIYAVRRGARVLYLNLERFGTTDSFFHGEGQTDFGDLLYAVKSKRNNLNIKLESTLRQDASGVYFYASPKVALDLQEMDETDVKTLLDELCASGRYDCIITDIDLDLNPKVEKILEYSSKIVFVSDGTDISNMKLERGLQTMRLWAQQKNEVLMSQAYLYYNKFSNKTSKAVQGLDMEELGGVPRFEHATTQQVIEQLINIPNFAKLYSK